MKKNQTLRITSENRYKMSENIKSYAKNNSKLLTNLIYKKTSSQKHGGFMRSLNSIAIKILALTYLLIAAQGCGGGGSGSGGGAPASPTVTTVNHIFYVGCADQSTCTATRLYQLTKGQTVAKKIGDVDNINVFYNGDNSGDRKLLVVYNDKVYFAGLVGTDVNLYEYDPTQPEATGLNPKPIDIPNYNPGSSVYDLVRVNSILYFTVSTTTYGREIYQYDTTLPASSSNPSVVYDFEPGSAGSSASNLYVHNSKIYFAAQVSVGLFGKELYVYDPAVAASSTNPSLIKDIKTGGSDSNPRNFKALNDKIYFNADSIAEGTELWVYDTSAAISLTNPKVVYDLYTGISGSNPKGLSVIGSKIYFAATDPADDYDKLFVLDTTQAFSSTNPSLACDVNGTNDDNVYQVESHQGKVFFSADSGSENELWMFDPEAAVSSTNPQIYNYTATQSADIDGITSIGDTLYFNAKATAGNLYFYNLTVDTVANPTQVEEQNPTGMNRANYEVVEWIQTIINQ